MTSEMTSLCRNLMALLILVWPLMHTHLFSHAASTSPPITRQRIIYVTEEDDYDYKDNYDGHEPPSKVPSSSINTPLLHQEPCQYDSCSELQVPCAQLSARFGCLCPGLSGADVRPLSPRIKALVPVSEGKDRGKIEVQWCAPTSLVSEYRVVVEGRDALTFGDAVRHGLVGSLEVGTKVCVVSVNKAGSSEPSDFSCLRYEASESSDHKLLALVIGGGVALLLLLVLGAVIIWKYQKFRKAKRNSSEGLGNPSYSKGGTL